ncbi:MAG: pyridoxal-phosphate dependent enzyme, partial [Pseudomonadota bacterium]
MVATKPSSAVPAGAPSDIRLVLNPKAAPPDAPLAGPLSAEGFEAAKREISTWSDYAPTPLLPLPGLAASLGVGAVWYKDEAQRFGLGSFKPLGAGFALAKAIAARLQRDGIAGNPTVSDVVSGRDRDATRAITVVSATDGNHGRALAWAGRRFGAYVEIIVHSDVSTGRRAAMEALGANVTVSAGNYDDTVREAFALGEAFDWLVVQDTSAGTYRAVPIDICHGYGIIA